MAQATSKIETLSLIAYAKHRNVSKQAVSKMIAEGRISSRSYLKDAQGYHINPVLADAELEGNDLGFAAPAGRKTVSIQESVEDSANMMALRRKKMELSIRKDAIELSKLQGKLVEKDKVFDVLYEFGQTMRQNLQVIPNKIVDDVMAVRTRNEAHKIIADAIDAALLDLIRVGELNFEKR